MYKRKKIKTYRRIKWIPASRHPKCDGEYLVVWRIPENGYPVTTCMEWDGAQRKWLDVLSPHLENNETSRILYWTPLPKAPAGIQKEIRKI